MSNQQQRQLTKLDAETRTEIRSFWDGFLSTDEPSTEDIATAATRAQSWTSCAVGMLATYEQAASCYSYTIVSLKLLGVKATSGAEQIVNENATALFKAGTAFEGAICLLEAGEGGMNEVRQTWQAVADEVQKLRA